MRRTLTIVLDIEVLARREGEAWAKARLEHLRELGLPIPMRWPGLLALAYMTAEDLADVRAIQFGDIQKLAARIQEHAARTWAELVHAA